MENLSLSPLFKKTSIVSLCTLALVACEPSVQLLEAPNQLPASFTGKYLAVLSDGDWIGQTYADDVLPIENLDIMDALTLAQPDGTISEVKGENASNAVTGTPEVMDITSDGNLAFIGELDKQRPAGATRGSDIPEGNTLRALSLQNIREPSLISSVTVPNSPNVVKVNPAGNIVAIGHQRNPDAALTLVPFQAGMGFSPSIEFGAPQSFTATQLGFENDDYGNMDVQWHPSGRYVAFISAFESKLILAEVIQNEDGTVALEPWGNTVQTGLSPNFGAKFTPDGRFLMVVNANNRQGNQVLNYLFGRASSISVVRLADAENPQHEVIQEIGAGRDDEGFAISPDGRYLVTMNQYGTYAPRFVPGHNNTPELRLFEITETGELTLLDIYDFTGYLPQGITFDTDGDTLAVSVSQQTIVDQSAPGAVYFYSLSENDNGKAALTPLPERLTVMRGVHELEAR
jgi:hypothetical protein